MKIILHKNPALVIFVRLGMALVLAVGVLAGAPAILVRAAGCVVSSTLDDGSAGTLRAAIDDVSCDTITFDAGLAGATITLASTLTLAHDVSIDGSALATQVRISGGHRYEVLYVNSDVAADLKGLIIFNGYNLVSKRGGGIYNAGKLTMTNSTVAGSHAGGKNDNPVRAGSNNPDAYGGGIYNDGVLTVMDSTFSENNASYCGDAYGGAIYNASVLSVTDSTFFGNFIQECGTNNGGAIANAGVLTVMGSTFSGNITDGGWFEGVSYGGGIYNTGTSTVAKSIFVDNTAAVIWNEGFGAGIYSTGVMTVTDSSFSGNHADNSGGGIENNGKLEVANSTFSGNSAGPMFPVRGGGIENRGTLTVMNSTFSDNNTGDNWSDGTAGGGIDNSGNLTLLNSTFSGNSAGNYSKAVGGGIDNSGAMDFANIIIANSTGLHGLDCLSTGTIGANTNNLVRDGSCSQGGVNFKKGDPKLGKLADNGGPTQTLALLPGSPAINAGDDATCAAAPVNNLDQRGVTRPSSLHCDIGAYELVQVPKERARNGGFNTYAGASKIPSGWTAVNFAASDGKFTAAKQEGAASVLMAGRAGVTKTLKQTLVLSGVAGDTFSFSFWVRGAGIPAAGTCRAQVLLYNGAVLKSTKTVNCPVGTYGVFQNKTLNFTATSAFTEVVIKLSYAKAGGRVWFDAVSLSE